MSSQTRTSDPDDPLEGFSGLSLFPRTLATVPNPPQPYDPNDLHHAHNFLKSMPLNSPNKLSEQAKSIVDGSSRLSNSEIQSNATSIDKNEAAATEVVDNLRQRRPDLGRKRAQFSFKPNSSQLTVNLEPTLDIDKLKDPEEFFKAYERFENAKREIQKQTGVVLMDMNHQNPSMAPRPRRPGILGRKRSVKYKHRYPIDISSQEIFKENILSPSNYNVQQETTNPNVASQETKLADAELQESDLDGAIAKQENRISELLNELLTGEDEELDDDGTIALLQEHLHIKPIDLGKLCLPDLQDVRRIDLKASGADLPKRRNSLSDIHNLVKGMNSKTPKKRKLALSSIPCLASPTPPKSPLAAIISLKKHILHSNSSIDPFSAHDIDQSPARSASPFGSIEKQIDEVNMENVLSISPKLNSPMREENGIADVHTSLPEVVMGDATHSSDKTVNDNLSRLDSGVDVGSSGFLADAVGSAGDTCLDNKVVCEISSRPDADTNAQTNEPIEFNDKVEDVLQEAVDSVQPELNMEDSTSKKLNSTQTELDQTSRVVVEDGANDGSFKSADTGPQGTQQHNEVNSVQPDHNLEDSNAEKLNNTQTELDQTRRDMVEDHAIDGPSKTADAGPQGPQHHNEVNSVQPDLSMEDFTVEKLNSTQTESDQTSRGVVEDHAMDGPSKTAAARPQQRNEEFRRSTTEPSNKQSKTSLPRRKGKREVTTRRQSLAASGTSWESGVRKSTRIKSRPLEYWKGERFLYGRVHESLTTVIGIKYESPGNADGKPGVKVKSFVSDKYKDLVELAARF